MSERSPAVWGKVRSGRSSASWRDRRAEVPTGDVDSSTIRLPASSTGAIESAADHVVGQRTRAPLAGPVRLREIEAELNRRRGESQRASDIPLTNFRGIEIRTFAAETLGARPGDVMTMVMRESTGLTLAGLAYAGLWAFARLFFKPVLRALWREVHAEEVKKWDEMS